MVRLNVYWSGKRGVQMVGGGRKREDTYFNFHFFFDIMSRGYGVWKMMAQKDTEMTCLVDVPK